MSYDKEEYCFVSKKGGYSFKTINIASGIKSFGILQMLLRRGFLNERALLILDEPEVNMHPKLQIKCAELLVDIAKELKTSILLTSHSPYFIEAIKVFSDSANFSNKTNFYFSTGYIEPVDNKINKFGDTFVP
ncbi:AAA family ATPase [Lutispora sp.]|uniref:AAA family ATPase n=1 Tax=Lutispora sp. TaxID=2828727 RepID=UPI003FA529CC